MTFCQAVTLAIVQGITEFLPISSSGHLVFFQKIFQFSEPPVFLDVLLHLGTMAAVLVFLRKKVLFLVKEWRTNINIWFLLAVGTLPAAFFGFFLNSKIKAIFNSLTLLAVMWILFGICLLLSRFFISRKTLSVENLKKVGLKDALIIGFFQAAALFPGFSRSGLTLLGALSRNLSRQTAFEFSFLLAIPAISGAVVLEWQRDGLNGVSLLPGIFSLIISGIVGYFSLKFLEKTLKSDKFYWFGFYCLVMGLLTLFSSLVK